MCGFSDRIKEIRKSRKLTQVQVATGINISEQAYQKYEYGKREPGIAFAIALADYFNVSLDYLVGRSDDPTRR